MFINGEQADVIRAKAVKLVTDVLDFTRGDLVYQDVRKGYQPGFGTSCTFLPHWMLLQLGVTNDNKSKGVSGKTRGLINRTDLARGTTLVPGDGVSVIANSPAFVKMKPNLGAVPFPGDIVVIQSEPYKQSDEHVFVFLGKISDTAWDTGESGEARSDAKNGVIEAKRKSCAMRISANSMIAAAADGKRTARSQGRLDISNWITSGSLP